MPLSEDAEGATYTQREGRDISPAGVGGWEHVGWFHRRETGGAIDAFIKGRRGSNTYTEGSA